MISWNEINHWKEDEFRHPELLRPKMVDMLDDLRDQYPTALIVSSSWRDPVHNKKVGGASNSSHIVAPDGFYSGIDLTTPANVFTGHEYFLIQKVAYRVGFRRIGLYKDFAHIHLDIEERLPQDVLWID